MIVTHEILIDCSEMTPIACSDDVLQSLRHGPGFSLRAEKPADVVNGSVSIVHNDPPEPHLITVELYEIKELPTAYWENGELVGRESTLEPAPNRVSRETLIERLKATFS